MKREQLFFVILAVLLMLNACTRPQFSEQGKKYFENIESSYNCLNVSSRSIILTGNSAIRNIIIDIKSCAGFLFYDSISKSDSLKIKQIACNFYKNCENNGDYNGIEINIYRGENESCPYKCFRFKESKNKDLELVKYSVAVEVF